VALAFAPALFIARHADDQALLAAGRTLEEALGTCERRCLELLG
jgi:hypothetical protein